MKKVFLVIVCSLFLGLMSAGSSAENVDPGQGAVQLSSDVPKKEAEADNLLHNAESFLKEGKIKEAQDLVEKVKKSNLKDAIPKANSLEAKISTASREAEANASLKIARLYLDASQPKEALDYAEKAIKSNPNILIKEKDLIISILKQKVNENNQKLLALMKAGESSCKTGEYDKAIEKANEVLSGPLTDATIRQQAESLLTKAVDEKNKNSERLQSFELNVAKRLTKQKDFDKASEKIIKDIIPKIKGDEAFNEAEEAWTETQPNFWHKLSIEIITYLKWPIIGTILITIFCVLLKLARLVYKTLRGLSEKLQFLELNDETKLGVKDLFVAALYHWKVDKPSGTDGQLRLELPRNSSHLGPLPQEKLYPALAMLPTIGSIPVGDLGKTITFMGKWFAYCPPWLSATFVKDDKGQIVAQVTLERENGKVALLSIWPEQAQPVFGEQIKDAHAGAEPPAPGQPPPTPQNTDIAKAVKRGAESLAFKILYLLADENATVDEADAFDQLRNGMGLLNRYIDGDNFDDLKKSRNIFQNVREKWPRLLPAYLYEGLAMGLLEDHDEAARNFEFVKQQAQLEGDEGLRQRAAYNEAWAHLQKYTYEEVVKSLSLLEDLIGPIDDHTFDNSPLKAKAYADEAFAIACQPLFWRKVLPKLLLTESTAFDETYLPENESPAFDESYLPELKYGYWLTELQQQIHTITNALDDLLEEIDKYLLDVAITGRGLCIYIYKLKKFFKKHLKKGRSFPDWNRSHYRRLQWGKHNAQGQFYLNCVIGILAGGQFPSLDIFDKQDFLDKAMREFQQCEFLLPSRVETLADIGTLFLYQGHYEEARNYLVKAKNWNNWYEYAFYRLAQTWEKQNNFDKVVETLNEFKESQRPPRIEEFKEMYEKYNIYPTLG